MPKGGLGVINIEIQNQALLMKNLDMFSNRRDIPWVNLIWEKHYKNGKLPSHVKKGSFWWRDVLKLLSDFKGLAVIQIRNGQTCFFWKDKWLNIPLEQNFHEIHSFAKNKLITVNRAFSQDTIIGMFNLPLSQTSFTQMQNLQQIMEATTLENSDDIWSYNGGSNRFSTSRTYRKLIGHQPTDPAFKWIWKSYCQPKHKVFCWLLLKDRLSTRNILRIKHMELDFI